jgi:hypothetical protein
MDARCQAFRDALVESSTLEAGSLHECSECAAYARRFSQRESVLRSLERHTAPTELEGRTIAALEAGYREDRAVAALRDLARVDVPSSLDRAVERVAGEVAQRATSPVAAPDVLRRLVEEELSDPSKARARRFVGSLPREAAPAELDARVAAELARPERPRRFRSKLLAVSFAVVVLAISIQIAISMRASRSRIQWIAANDTSEISPMAATLFSGVSGGASDLLRGGGAR